MYILSIGRQRTGNKSYKFKLSDTDISVCVCVWMVLLQNCLLRFVFAEFDVCLKLFGICVYLS